MWFVHFVIFKWNGTWTVRIVWMLDKRRKMQMTATWIFTAFNSSAVGNIWKQFVLFCNAIHRECFCVFVCVCFGPEAATNDLICSNHENFLLVFEIVLLCTVCLLASLLACSQWIPFRFVWLLIFFSLTSVLFSLSLSRFFYSFLRSFSFIVSATLIRHNSYVHFPFLLCTNVVYGCCCFDFAYSFRIYTSCYHAKVFLPWLSGQRKGAAANICILS